MQTHFGVDDPNGTCSQLNESSSSWAMVAICLLAFEGIILTASQTSDPDLASNNSYETFQPSHQHNLYLDSGLNNTAFFQNSSGFQQPVRNSTSPPVVV